MVCISEYRSFVIRFKTDESIRDAEQMYDMMCALIFDKDLDVLDILHIITYDIAFFTPEVKKK